MRSSSHLRYGHHRLACRTRGVRPVVSGPTLVLPGELDVRTLHRDLHTVRTAFDLVELDAARQALDLLVEVGDRTHVGVGEGDVAEAGDRVGVHPDGVAVDDADAAEHRDGLLQGA